MRHIISLLDQCIFVLDNSHYLAFIEQVDAPSQNTEGRERLMDTKSGWKNHDRTAVEDS